jgi:hypothetical protein
MFLFIVSEISPQKVEEIDLESRTCYVCEKNPLEKDEVGLNKKLLGRKIAKFYCYECLAEYLEVDIEFLFAKIEEFKKQGCKLF